MAVYNITLVNSNGNAVTQPIGASSENILIQNEGTTTLTDKLSSINQMIANKANNENVTITTNGLMSSEDKIKLDNIEEYANNYSLPIASNSILGGVKIGNGIAINSEGVISNSIILEDGVTLMQNIKVANMASANSEATFDTIVGQLVNIAYTSVDEGEGIANPNEGLLICVYE